MKYAIVFVLLGTVLFGCTAFAPVREKVEYAVEAYCKRPYEERVLLRNAINDSLAESGAAVKVTCKGDPE